VWTKDVSKVRNTFNARAERVATAPTFRAPFKRQRALVPADSYLEWKKIGTAKQPYLFERADGEPLVFAGLWDHWRNPELGDGDDAWVRSVTIITTSAAPDIDGIHDRSPV
jgi:putative SOS response-associated peptidase YedK